MCGKDWTRCTFWREIRGSPPHVRERLPIAHLFFPLLRITPACAGKTDFGFINLTTNRDHPRMCGKDVSPYRELQTNPGSPPHVRERRVQVGKAADDVGITPACAGKTRPVRLAELCMRDHPRMCGKDRVGLAVHVPEVGSPPHVRERLCR